MDHRMEGLWYAHFKSPQIQGEGMAVLRDGEILGGDPNHTYTGTYQWDGGHVYASVRVSPYAGVPTPNPHEQPFTLFLRGSVTGDTATVAGHPDDRNDVQIAVELHRAA